MSVTGKLQLIFRKRLSLKRRIRQNEFEVNTTFNFLANLVENKSRDIILVDDSVKVEIYLIKEGVSPDSGGIGLWFNSLLRNSSLHGNECLVYSCDGVTYFGSDLEQLGSHLFKVNIKQAIGVRVLRNHLVRRVFARYGFDAEEVLNFLFVYFFVQFIRKLKEQNIGLGKVVTPVYEGYGAYLPASWPIWVGLVSNTRHSIQNLSIAKSRYRRHYLPKIRKEEFLLKKFKNRIAISESIIGEYKGIRDDETFQVSPPQIIDPKLAGTKRENSEWNSLAQRKKVILFLGRMEPRKGFDILLDAWEISQLSKKGYELHMCGEYGENLPAKFQNIDGVQFRGRITQHEKDKYLTSSSLVVIPSRFESFGIVTLEAMANHTPVLVSDVAGLRYVSSIANSVQVFSEGDAFDCASKMSKILESEFEWNKLSRSVRKDFEELFLLN